MSSHFVKLRKKGERLWKFLETVEGHETYHRVRALRFTEQDAVKVAVEIERENPDFEAKTVLITGK